MKNIKLLIVVLVIVAFSSSVIEGKNKMVFVKGGLYSTERDNNDDKWKKVKLSVKDFFIDQYEVSVREFLDFVSKTKYVTWAEKNGNLCTVYGGKKKKSKLEM